MTNGSGGWKGILGAISVTIGIFATLLSLTWGFALEPRVGVIAEHKAAIVEDRLNARNDREHAALKEAGEAREDRIVRAIDELKESQKETQRLLNELLLRERGGR